MLVHTGGRQDASGDAVPGGGAVFHPNGNFDGAGPRDREGSVHHVQRHDESDPLHLFQIPPPAADGYRC